MNGQAEKVIEFFFDCSSPWTYLAFSRVHAVAARTGARIEWRPILVGGVFNAVNQDVYEQRANPNPLKAAYYRKDLADWARLCGVRIGMPPVFPVRAVEAMRGALVADGEGMLVPYVWAVFQAYWGDLKDISDRNLLAELAQGAGLDRGDFLARIDSPAIREKLRDNTEEMIRRGGFGSPTMFVNGDDMYFGNDRLPLVELALAAGGQKTGASYG